jgi:hypothetical protein
MGMHEQRALVLPTHGPYKSGVEVTRRFKWHSDCHALRKAANLHALTVSRITLGMQLAWGFPPVVDSWLAAPSWRLFNDYGIIERG